MRGITRATREIRKLGKNDNASDLFSYCVLLGHDGPVWQVAWAHPKFGSLLASCSYDRRVIIWKEERENEWVQLQQFSEHESSVNSIAWAPYEYGAVLACASSDGSVSVLTHKPDGTWERVKIPGAHPVGCTAVSWAPANVPGAIAGDPLLLVADIPKSLETDRTDGRRTGTLGGLPGYPLPTKLLRSTVRLMVSLNPHGRS